MDDLKPEEGNTPGEKPVSVVSDEDSNTNDKNIMPTEDKVNESNVHGGNNGINRYLLVAIAVIIVLLIIAYVMYHFNILGVRALVRNTLGLNHKTITNSTSSSSSNLSSANAALISTVSSYFPSENLLNLTASSIKSNNLNSSGFIHYSVFGEGSSVKPFENGTFPENYSGLLMIFGLLNNNETFNYYYKGFVGAEKIYNLSFDSIPTVVAVDNITPPANSSLMSSEGSMGITSYSCRNSILKVVLQNKMNETLKLENFTSFNEYNVTGNSSDFLSSGYAEQNKSITVTLPNERCNSSSYAVILVGKTNYSISNLSTFTIEIRFSNVIKKYIPMEVVTALGVSSSKLYEISTLAEGVNYINQVNSSLNKMIENLSPSDFS